MLSCMQFSQVSYGLARVPPSPYARPSTIQESRMRLLFYLPYLPRQKRHWNSPVPAPHWAYNESATGPFWRPSISCFPGACARNIFQNRESLATRQRRVRCHKNHTISKVFLQTKAGCALQPAFMIPTVTPTEDLMVRLPPWCAHLPKAGSSPLARPFLDYRVVVARSGKRSLATSGFSPLSLS